jgi:urease accessory protein
MLVITQRLSEQLSERPSEQLSEQLSERPSEPGDRPELCPELCLERAEFTLLLTAEERGRSRHYFESVEGAPCSLQLPRGTVLRDGDVLLATSGDRVRVVAKLEPVVTVTAHTPLELLRAAYHLGNRHVPLEVRETYLRFSPDPVLQDMMEKMGLHMRLEEQPFQPETGAYQGLGVGGWGLGQAHGHSHPHDHSHDHAHGREHSHLRSEMGSQNCSQQHLQGPTDKHLQGHSHE